MTTDKTIQAHTKKAERGDSIRMPMTTQLRLRCSSMADSSSLLWPGGYMLTRLLIVLLSLHLLAGCNDSGSAAIAPEGNQGGSDKALSSHTGPLSLGVKGDDAFSTKDREVTAKTQQAATIEVKLSETVKPGTNVVIEIRDAEQGYITKTVSADDAKDSVVTVSADVSALEDGPLYLSAHTTQDGTASEKQIAQAVKRTSDLPAPQAQTKLPPYTQEPKITISGTVEENTRVLVYGGKTPVDVYLGDGETDFEVEVDLKEDKDNTITVCSEKDDNVSCNPPDDVAQIDPDDFINATVTSKPLTTEEIEALVEQGIIDLDDPDNYHVTEFTICFGINSDVCFTSYEPTSLLLGPSGGGTAGTGGGSGGSGGGGCIPVIEDCDEDDSPGPQPRVGVLIIEGRIKTLKEFFEINLVLINSSQKYAFTNIKASIELPEGLTLVAAGAPDALDVNSIEVAMADIPPSTLETAPGASVGRFIVRGDAAGVYDVLVSFTGQIEGPGLTEPLIYEPAPLSDTLTVVGPPPLQLDVVGPTSVTNTVPFGLDFTVTNLSEVASVNYASMELDVGMGFYFTDPSIPCFTFEGDPMPAGSDCCEGRQTSTYSIGHLVPLGTWNETVSLTSCITGTITSCSFTHDDNLKMSVSAGINGCQDQSITTIGNTSAGPSSITNLSVSSMAVTSIAGEGSHDGLYVGAENMIWVNATGVNAGAEVSLSHPELLVVDSVASPEMLPMPSGGADGVPGLIEHNVSLRVFVPWDFPIQDVTLTLTNPGGVPVTWTLPVYLDGLPRGVGSPHLIFGANQSATEEAIGKCFTAQVDSQGEAATIDYCSSVGVTEFELHVWAGLRPDLQVLVGASAAPVDVSVTPNCQTVEGVEFCTGRGLISFTVPESLVASPGTIPLAFRVGDGSGGHITNNLQLEIIEP